MLAIVGLALVNDLATVNRILEQVKQAATLERDATTVRAAGAEVGELFDLDVAL